MAEINDKVLSLSAQIAASVTVDKEAGKVDYKVEEGKDNVYVQNLPEGITAETVAQINDYNALFVAAGTHAVGNAGIDAFVANKDLTRVNATLPTVGKDAVKISMERTKPLPGQEGVVTYGSVQAQFDVYADGNRGQLKLVKTALRERATSLLGS